MIRHRDEIIGKLPSDVIPPVGEHLLLNGRRWQVVDIDGKTLVVEVTPAKGRRKPVFLGNGGSIHRVIVEKMREILAGGQIPSYLHPDAAGLLGAARAFARKHRIFDIPWIETATGCVLFPWTGTKGMETLRLCAQSDEIEVEMKNLIITYRCDPERLQEHLKRVADRAFVPVDLATRLVMRFRDKFDELVPADLVDVSNSERSLSIVDASEAASAVLQ